MKTQLFSYILFLGLPICLGALRVELDNELDPEAKILTVTSLKRPKVCTQHAEPGDFLKVHYTGHFKDENGDVFDSSKGRGHPFEFVLGKGQVIQGYELAVPGMCLGETRGFYVPSHLAYGEQGYPPTIPPKSDLYFVVDLVYIDRSNNPDLK
uniref:peptidylprolyl isomerase n=1 Tax=Caligus clemensi TaxID=344056 RepID=C1BZZ5_CALCM|nr:FK506-binding protein 2 precursor [Caligus clemensi]